MANTVKNVFPNVPACLPAKSQLPNGTSRMIWKWSYSADRIGETVTIRGVKVKKLLTLDLNVPEEEFASMVNSAPPGTAEDVFVKNFPCIHDCAGCFVNTRPRNPILTLEEIWKIVDQAQELGDESVKFLGPGELLINPRLFEILDEFSRRNLVLGIFTKGAVMGNDMLSHHYHGISSEELVQKLVSYPNVTFLIGGLSFDPKSENRFVPRNKQEIKVEFDYHQARNLAIERLCHAGMNTDLEKPRLAIVCSPVTAHNIGHVAEIYKWGAERNIPVYLPPTMVSGKGHKLVRGSMEKKFEDDYIALAVEVYTWAIERGVMTLEQFKREGPHPYIGVAPCNQLTHGLYVHCDGAVWRCPGNDTPDFVVHNNIRDGTLLDIWRGSKNYRINKFNNGCVKDRINLPRRFYSEVKRRVEGQ